MTPTDDTDVPTAAPEVFSDPWAQQICRALAASDDYRRAAEGWEGALAFEVASTASPEAGGEPGRAVVLDLHHGACRGARAASQAELDEGLPGVPFVIRAQPQAWRDILERGTDPLFALMSGKLKLARGSLGALMPFARAAQMLVATVRAVPGTLPAGWTGRSAGNG